MMGLAGPALAMGAAALASEQRPEARRTIERELKRAHIPSLKPPWRLPESWYRATVARLQTKLREQKLRGVLCTSGHNHNYERLVANGQIYLVAGTGGAGLYTFTDPPLPETQLRDDTHFGALRLTATCECLTSEFVDIGGNVIDSIQLCRTTAAGNSGPGRSSRGGSADSPGTILIPPAPCPPASCDIISSGILDPRFPVIVPTDPTAWSIYLQVLPTGETVNTWYWSPVLQNYI